MLFKFIGYSVHADGKEPIVLFGCGDCVKKIHEAAEKGRFPFRRFVVHERSVTNHQYTFGGNCL